VSHFVGSLHTSVAANLQNSVPNTPKHGPSNEKLAASTMPVAAELQNSALSTSRLTASSQKPVAPPVAAELQNSVPINPKPVDSHKPVATSNPVAADLQDSTLSRSRLEHLLRYQPKVASSQKPVAPPVAAELQNSALSSPKLTASSQKPVASSSPCSGRIAKLSAQRSQTGSIPSNTQLLWRRETQHRRAHTRTASRSSERQPAYP